MKRMILAVAGAFAALAVAAPVPAEAGPTASRAVLTLDGARHVLRAAADEARRLGAGGAIAVVDDGGHLLLLERLDDTFPAAAIVSYEKARTAATFRRDTRIFEDAIRNGRTSLVAVDVMTPLQGGVPIVMGGVVVGAVGVSGAASAQQDEDIAKVAAVALDGVAAPPVGYIPSREVEAAFAKGVPLLENGSYKIHASRREKPGLAEVHEGETDIIYVLEGRATFVTGGRLEGGAPIAAGEIRAPGIQGGDVRTLVPGDVVVVPAGTPHWFRDVDGPFLYYVVKTIGKG
jgi:glc operon protein GlcG